MRAYYQLQVVPLKHQREELTHEIVELRAARDAFLEEIKLLNAHNTKLARCDVCSATRMENLLHSPHQQIIPKTGIVFDTLKSTPTPRPSESVLQSSEVVRNGFSDRAKFNGKPDGQPLGTFGPEVGSMATGPNSDLKWLVLVGRTNPEHTHEFPLPGPIEYSRQLLTYITRIQYPKELKALYPGVSVYTPHPYVASNSAKLNIDITGQRSSVDGVVRELSQLLRKLVGATKEILVNRLVHRIIVEKYATRSYFYYFSKYVY